MRKTALAFSEPASWVGPLVLAFLTLVFYSRILFTNRAIIPWDAGDFFYPLLGFVHEELRHFRIPLWSPFSFAGFPVIADPEAQIFYPPNWLMTLTSLTRPLSYRLMEVQIVSHYFWAGLTMYWLVKDWTGKRLPAITAGVIYMFSGPLATHAQHQSIVNALGWYPMVFLLARRALHRRDWRAAALAGASYGMVCLIGHYQSAAYLALLVFLYFVYEAGLGADRKMLWPWWILALGTIALIGVGLSMIQILPTAELSALSIRDQLVPQSMAGGRDPRYLWTYFLPNFFGEYRGAHLRLIESPHYEIAFISVPGCVLALVGLAEMARRKNFFWLIVIVAFSLASLGVNGPLFNLVYGLPLLKLFRNMFIFINLAIFGAAIMAGVGAAALEEPAQRKFHLPWLRVFLVAAFGFAVCVGHWQGWINMIPHYWYMLLGLGITSALILAWPEDARTICAVQWTLLLLATAELFNFHMNKPFNAESHNPQTFMAYDSLYDRKQELEFLRSDKTGGFRVANTMGWPTNYWNLVRIPATYGWNPVLLSRYNEYVRQFMQTNLYAFADAGPDNNLRSAMQDLLGIKYYLTVSLREDEMKLASMPNLRKVYDGAGWFKVYENPSYLKRAWVFPRAYVVPDNATALALMNSRWFRARRSLVMEQGDLAATGALPVEELQTYVLPPSEDSSSGSVIDDPLCAKPRRYRAYWGGFPRDWQRFPLPKGIKPGKYLITAEYFTNDARPMPVIVTSLRQAAEEESRSIAVLRTSGTSCSGTRSIDLGTFNVVSDSGDITLTAQVESEMSVYGLTLIRLPANDLEESSEDNEDFSFRDFDISSNHYRFTVESSKPGLLLMNEIYYPGWTATVDGKKAELLRADSIFRALHIEVGTHQIEMKFFPKRLFWGALVSMITVACLAIFLLRDGKKGVD